MTAKTHPARRVAQSTTRPWVNPGTWLPRSISLFVALLAGYSLFNHALAWVHVPGTPVFVGEVVLATGVLGALGASVNLRALVRRSLPLALLAAFMAWGMFRMTTGFTDYRLDAVRDSAIWYYGSFAFLMVLAVGVRTSDWLMSKYARLVPVLLLWLPVALVLGAVASDLAAVPDSSVSVFSHHPSQMAIHGIMAIGFLWTLGRAYPRLYRWRVPLTAVGMALVLLTTVTSRASLVSSALGVLILMLGLRETRARLAWFAASLLIATAALGVLFEIEIDLFGNERPISVNQILDNATSIVAPERLGTGDLVANREWRTAFWAAVISGVNRQFPLTGYGFGINLRDEFGVQDDDPPSRHPHSSHVNVVARMGWIGGILWLALWSAWFATVGSARGRLLRTGKGQAAALALIVMVGALMYLVQGIFNEVAEGPHSGIWLWSLFGLGVAIALATDSLRSQRKAG